MSDKHTILFIWIAIECVAQILTIGRQRKARTPGEALMGIAQWITMLWLAVSA